MEKTVLWTALLAIFIVIGLPHGSHAARKPKIQTGPEAEVSFDGLHRVDKTVMDEVWAKPDLDLTGYKKIMLASGGLAFREVKSRSARTYRASSEAEFPISEDSKERLREIVREAFAKELAKVERFEITDTPGRDVLIIVGSIIDIVSHVPPEPIGRVDIYLESVGEATLVLEVRDSMSNEVLVRAADRKAADQSGMWMESNPVTNWLQVRRAARAWASLLRRRLNEVATLTDEA